MPRRNLYLKNTPLKEALDTYLDRVRELIAPHSETIRTEDALGRVTACPIWARISSPSYNAAAMDGIAVEAARTAGASEVSPLRLAVGEDYQVIDTGDPVNPPFDAVIMAEDVIEVSEGLIELLAAAAPWSNIRPIGEDFAQAEMILPSFHIMRPVDLGLLLSGGITTLEVTVQPSVAVIPTGTELVEPDAVSENSVAGVGGENSEKPGASSTQKPGAIIDSNSRMIAALVTESGGIPHRMPIVADDYQSLKQTIKTAVAAHDLVLINAGSSAGTEDYTAPILRELGEVLIHGVAVKPGKPVILAVVDGKPVIGLPGYPLATFFNFNTFARPVMELFTGIPRANRAKIKATLAKRLVSSLKFREYVQVNVGLVDEKLIAAPLSRGAGVISSLVRADGYLVIDQELEGLEAGAAVEVNLYRDLYEVTRTVLAIGSHDLALDLIADLMPHLHPHMHLSSTHVGSLAGLNALKRGEAHLAPCHLLDEETGLYNIPTIQELFDNEPMALIKGLKRIQGFILPPGNPQNITCIEDLPGTRYINRQRGAGTRILLDYRLKQAGINPAELKGYDREATTHMAVASAVAAGSADVGLGVQSAATALGLDFVELGHEEYDFALPQAFLGLGHIQAFISVLKSPELRERLEQLGGYGFDGAGEVLLIEPRDTTQPFSFCRF
ncbi:MAG: molybdopterin biosynthesis protein [Coriobacteriia bacterium]|nr:molybdopterin biosynthesis protein [Coriobacteriia bacterium]